MSAGSPTAVPGPAGLAPPLSGSASRRRVACSSGEALRQISASPATENTCGQAQPEGQPWPNTPTTNSRKANTVARATARPMPAESDRARLAMLRSSPAAGISSQAATYSGTANPPVTIVIRTKRSARC